MKNLINLRAVPLWAYPALGVALLIATLILLAMKLGSQQAHNTFINDELQELIHATKDAKAIRDLNNHKPDFFINQLCRTGQLRDGDCNLPHHE